MKLGFHRDNFFSLAQAFTPGNGVCNDCSQPPLAVLLKTIIPVIPSEERDLHFLTFH